MAKKRINKRSKMPPNIFADGGPTWGQQSSTQFSEAFKKDNLGGTIGSIGGAVGGIAQSGVSNSQIADTSGVEDQINLQKNRIVGASNNDQLLSEWGSLSKVKDDYSWRDVRGGSTGQRAVNTIGAVGQGAASGASVGGPIGAVVGGVIGLGSAIGGWLTGNRKAKKKARQLNKEAQEANDRAVRSFELRADNIDKQNDFNLMANYAAYGGPLGGFGGGAIGYELANKELYNGELNALSKMRMPSMPNSFQALPEINTFNAFAEGGGLSREKNYGSKKKPYPSVPSGDFAGPHRSYPIPTKADARDALRLAGLHGNSSVREKVLSKYPSLRKKAYGGSLFEDIVWDDETPVLFKDGGGIHIKPENRGKFNATKKRTGKSTEELTHSKNPLTRKRAIFAQNAKKWHHAFGGWLNTQGGDFTNGVTFIDEGGTHEENPNEGVLMGLDPQGAPNLVEEGEVIFDDYVFSNRMEIPEDIRKEYKLRGKTFAKAAKSIQRESEERPNDPLSKRGLQVGMERLAQAQEEARLRHEAYEEGNKYPSMFAYGGDMDDYPLLDTPMSVEELEEMYNQSYPQSQGQEKEGGNKASWLRYAPIVGSGLASLSDIFSKPDYSGPESVLNSISGLSEVRFSPIGNYLSYNPFDRDFYINKLNQQAGATRRALENTSGGNRMNAQAGILAADYNYGQNLGNLARQAEEYNQQQRERVQGFNRGTNQFNSEGAMKAQIANKQNEELRFRGATTAAQMKQAIKDQDNARRSANLTNFLQGLGDMGWENEQANWLDTLAKAGVLKMNTKGQYTGGTKAKGGRINKKKGFTYG